MLTLVNPKNHPISIGDDETGFTIPAFGRRRSNIKVNEVPEGIVILPNTASAKPPVNKTNKSAGAK